MHILLMLSVLLERLLDRLRRVRRDETEQHVTLS